MKVSVLYVFCLCCLVGLAASSHFRGGIIQWRPVNARAFDGEIEITHRVAWRASSHGHYCNETTISSQTLLSLGWRYYLECQSGCSGIVGYMSFYCTDFSTSEDWTTGGRTYIYNATGITSFEALFHRCCWIGTVTVASHVSDYWELRVKGNLTERSDTGSVNHSPTSSAPLTVRLQYGCSHTIPIPVADADGDDVRCRWAEESQGECGGVCRVTNATLCGCNIHYTANETTGLYAVALQIEDFASKTDTVPLSSIPLQFVIEVFNSSAPCVSNQPEIVGATRCIGVSSTYRERIVAQSGDSNLRIVDIIITASPVGLLKSSLTESTTPQQWFVDVTWTPTFSHSGPNIFCYYAVNCIGLSSPETCITLFVGHNIIRLSGHNRTSTSSIDITLIYDLSVAMNATMDIQGTATPVDGSSRPIVVTIQGPITTPELNVSFTGLHSGTTYSFMFEALSRSNPSRCSGVEITDVFLRTDRQRLFGHNIIRLSGHNKTSTSSIDITLIYDLSVAMNATMDIQGTATPVDGSSRPIVVTIRGPITTPELNVSFTGLHSGTTYSFVFEALSRNNPSRCSGVEITDVFLRTDRQRLFVSNSSSSITTVGISIAISLVSFLAGALLVVLITCCCIRRRKKSSGQLQPSYGQPEPLQPFYSQPEPSHEYSEVEIKNIDTLEMKENVAYGPPVRH